MLQIFIVLHVNTFSVPESISEDPSKVKKNNIKRTVLLVWHMLSANKLSNLKTPNKGGKKLYCNVVHIMA